MIPIQEEGVFKAEIYAYGTKESAKAGSEAMALSIGVLLREKLDPATNEWTPITDSVRSADGDIWFIKADGAEDVTKVEVLMQATGWDGKLTTLDAVDPDTFLPLPEEKRWKPLPCIAVVKADDYLVRKGTGGMRYRLDSVRPLDPNARRVVTETGARRRAAKAAAAKAKAIGATAPKPLPPPEPGSNDIPTPNADGSVPF